MNDIDIKYYLNLVYPEYESIHICNYYNYSVNHPILLYIVTDKIQYKYTICNGIKKLFLSKTMWDNIDDKLYLIKINDMYVGIEYPRDYFPLYVIINNHLYKYYGHNDIRKNIRMLKEFLINHNIEKWERCDKIDFKLTNNEINELNKKLLFLESTIIFDEFEDNYKNYHWKE